jgi:hypothetical protein
MTTVSAVMFEIVEMYIFQIYLHYFFSACCMLKNLFQNWRHEHVEVICFMTSYIFRRAWLLLQNGRRFRRLWVRYQLIRGEWWRKWRGKCSRFKPYISVFNLEFGFKLLLFRIWCAYRFVSSTRISIIDIFSSEDNHWKYSSGSSFYMQTIMQVLYLGEIQIMILLIRFAEFLTW